jgi:hypothetical protein
MSTSVRQTKSSMSQSRNSHSLGDSQIGTSALQMTFRFRLLSRTPGLQLVVSKPPAESCRANINLGVCSAMPGRAGAQLMVANLNIKSRYHRALGGLLFQCLGKQPSQMLRLRHSQPGSLICSVPLSPFLKKKIECSVGDLILGVWIHRETAKAR